MSSKHKKNLLIGCLIFFFGTLLVGTVAAIPFQPTPDSPYENVQWGITNGDVYGWNMSAYDDSGILFFNQTYYYKINNTAKVRIFGTGDWYYAVQIRSMLYNQTTEEITFNPHNLLLHNVSLVNFTNNQMYASEGGQPITFFIPKSSSTQLMTDWVADASLFQYTGYFDPTSPPSISTTASSIRYYNDTSEEYVELNYDNRGALTSGEIFSKVVNPNGITQVITRIYGPPIGNGSPPNIPFGNSFFVIITVCIVGLVVYSKRKRS